MATIKGELIRMFDTVPFVHATGATVVATRDGVTVASGKVDSQNQFKLEVADDLLGEVEVTIGTDGVASTVVEATGEDLEIMIPYTPSGGYF